MEGFKHKKHRVLIFQEFCIKIETSTTYKEITREFVHLIPSQLLPQGSEPLQSGGRFCQLDFIAFSTATTRINMIFQVEIIYIQLPISNPSCLIEVNNSENHIMNNLEVML